MATNNSNKDGLKKPDAPVEPVAPDSKSKDSKSKKNESKYNPTVLRELVKSGANAKTIMEKMDIVHKQVLKHWLLRLSTTDRTDYEIPGLYDVNQRQAFVNSKGEIRFHMKNINFSDMELKPDDEFEVVVKNNQIILTKIAVGSKNPSAAAVKNIDEKNE